MNIFKRATRFYMAVRSTLANPTAWMLKAFGGGTESKSGVPVSADIALGVSTVFACVNLISNTMASLKIALFKRTDEGKEKATDRELYFLLHDLSNEETTAFDFWVMYIVNLLLTGDGFAYIERNGHGAITALKNVPTDKVTIYRNKETDELYYLIKDGEGNGQIVYPENMLHTRGMRFKNKDKSIDPIAMAREALGMTLALEEYGSKFFKNGANTGGVISLKRKLSDTAFMNFKKSFNEKYSGIGNSSKVLFLEDEAKFEKIGIDPDKAQSLESRKFQIAEIARFFYNVPLHKILELEKATFNNIEQLNIGFVQDCINPISVRIEQSIYKSLLLPGERKKYFAKFNTNALLRGDIDARKDFYQVMIQNGVFSPNDVLKLEDMNTYEGGNVHVFNGNAIAVENISKQNNGKGGEKSGEETENG